MRINGTPEKDFFKENPDAQYTDVGILLLERFTREEASKVMWMFYLVSFPDNKIMFEKPIRLRQEIVTDNYFKAPFDWEMNQDAFELFQIDFLTRVRRGMLVITDLFDKVVQNIGEMKIDTPTSIRTALTVLQDFRDTSKSFETDMAKNEAELDTDTDTHEIRIHGKAALGPRERRNQ